MEKDLYVSKIPNLAAYFEEIHNLYFSSDFDISMHFFFELIAGMWQELHVVFRWISFFFNSYVWWDIVIIYCYKKNFIASSTTLTHYSKKESQNWQPKMCKTMSHHSAFSRKLQFTHRTATAIHPLRSKASDQMIFIIICITPALSGSSEVGAHTDMCVHEHLSFQVKTNGRCVMPRATSPWTYTSIHLPHSHRTPLSIQSRRSRHATQHLCQRSSFKTPAKPRNCKNKCT